MSTYRVRAAQAVTGVALTALVVVGAVTAASKVAPTNDTPPTVSGAPTQGGTLTAGNGTWSGTDPITYTYQWRRCDESGGSCASISGATEKTYLLKLVDVANTLRVQVSAKNADGTATASSVPSAVVKAAATPPPTPVTGCPAGTGAIQVDGLAAPARLLIDGQALNPTVATRSTTSLSVRFHVSACQGRSVANALVYVTAVPYNMFSVPQELPTNADGWADLTMRRLAGYPATPKQQLLVMFVRARKPSDNVLSGISTRRLVSFPVRLGA